MYIYTFDRTDYKEDVKKFEHIMQMVNLGNIINFNNINITVTWVEMRSMINGKYFSTFATWYKIFEYIDYQDLMLKNVKTLQKLYNHLKFAIDGYYRNAHKPNVYQIVKYLCEDKF